MAFLFYSISFFFLIVATVLYVTRNTWKPYAPPIPYLTAPGTIPPWAYNIYDRITAHIDRYRYSALPQGFQSDAESGLHSADFDLAQNIEGEDSRSGLDGKAKAEIYGLMKRHKCTFDEARQLWTERRFAAAGIGPDGRPLDRKAVVFS